MLERKTKGTKRTEEQRGPLSSPRSFPSLPKPVTGTFIPPHGGYQNLLSYQKALVVYQATLYFCERFIDKRSRTCDQMVQATRSDKQNILEGSQASGTSIREGGLRERMTRARLAVRATQGRRYD